MKIVGFNLDQNITIQFDSSEFFIITHSIQNFCNNEIHKDKCSCENERDKVNEKIGECYKILNGELLRK